MVLAYSRNRSNTTGTHNISDGCLYHNAYIVMTNKELSYKIFFWSLAGIALVIIYLLLTQCTKEDCHVCTVTTTWFYGSHTVTAEKSYPYCDVTSQFLKDFEAINTYSDTTTKMIQTCICK